MSGMRPLGKLVSLEKALSIIGQASKPTQCVEKIPICAANGRILAADIKAGINVPSFARSAMDGFAVRSADVIHASTGKPIVLKIIDKIFAGDVAKKRIKSGQCAEIATGGMLPEGADAVVRVEDTSRNSRICVSILVPVRRGKSVINVGDDIRKGAVIVRKESLLTPAKIGSIAAIGIESVFCYQRPNIVLMPTGDEIVRPGENLKQGQVYDVNTFTLRSAAESFGAQVEVRKIVNDSKKSLIEAISSEQSADVIIFSGGSSVGEKDLIVDAVSELGSVLFHGVALRPGMPTLFGKVGKTLVLGMPGHPTSCLSNAYIFLHPMIERIGRFPHKERIKIKLRLSADVKLAEGRTTVVPVKVDGLSVTPVFKESSAITSMTNADGYVLVPPQKDLLKKGVTVEVNLF